MDANAAKCHWGTSSRATPSSFSDGGRSVALSVKWSVCVGGNPFVEGFVLACA